MSVDTDDEARANGKQLIFVSAPRPPQKQQTDNDQHATSLTAQVEAIDMYEHKDTPFPSGVPERWLKLLRKTHEVSSRIAQTLRNTIDHGREQIEQHSRRSGSGNDSQAGSYRAIEPTD